MEKDLLIGPMAVVAVAHSLLYWLVGGQEEDLGTMARSCWAERTKEAEARGRRAPSARRRICGCISLACLVIILMVSCCGVVSVYTEKTRKKRSKIMKPSRFFLITH